MTRDQALRYVVPLSGVGALLSIAFAVFVRYCQPTLLKPYGYILLGLWALLPPLWFIYEWTLAASLEEKERDRIKHFHDLARNLWLALILALSAIIGAVNPFK